MDIGQYKYNAFYWRTVLELASSLPVDGLDEKRLLHYAQSWQLVEERIDDGYGTSPGINRVAQEVRGMRHIDDAAARRTHPLTTPEIADLDNSSTVNIIDFLAFLNFYNDSDPIADFNGDGIINTQDFIAYLNAINHGC